MDLNEAKHLILQHEIRTPLLDDQKFNDESDLVDSFPQTSESERFLISEAIFKALSPIFKDIKIDELSLPLV